MHLTRSCVRCKNSSIDEEAKALKKLRKRWLKSADQLNVDELIARYEWRRRFPELRETHRLGAGLAEVVRSQI